MTRVLVTGGRDYADRDALYAVLDELRPTVIIHGNATGADTLAHDYAEKHHTIEIKTPAPFKYIGPVAGILRNIYMLDHFHPDLVVACPGNSGTENCIRNALVRGIRVRRVLA